MTLLRPNVTKVYTDTLLQQTQVTIYKVTVR